MPRVVTNVTTDSEVELVKSSPSGQEVVKVSGTFDSARWTVGRKDQAGVFQPISDEFAEKGEYAYLIGERENLWVSIVGATGTTSLELSARKLRSI